VCGWASTRKTATLSSRPLFLGNAAVGNVCCMGHLCAGGAPIIGRIPGFQESLSEEHRYEPCTSLYKRAISYGPMVTPLAGRSGVTMPARFSGIHRVATGSKKSGDADVLRFRNEEMKECLV